MITRTRTVISLLAFGLQAVVQISLSAPGDMETGFNPSTGIYGATVQPDGKILLTGSFSDVGYAGDVEVRQRIARLNADRSVDTSFGVDWSGANDTIYAAVVQPDGKILIAGEFTSVSDATGTYDRNYIARLNADGSVDSSFGSEMNGTDDYIRIVLLQSDGKIFIGGEFTSVSDSTGTYNRNYIARLDEDGSVDTSFGSDGKGPDFRLLSAALLRDGKVIVSGQFNTVSDGSGTYNRKGIVRLEADGSVDTSFGSTDVDYGHFIYSLALQSDGKIMIAGSIGNLTDSTGTYNRHKVARLHAHGSVDTSFGFDMKGPDNAVWGLALQADGKTVISGSFQSVSDADGSYNLDGVARFHPNGSVDTTFIPTTGAFLATPRTVTIQEDGKVIVGSEVETNRFENHAATFAVSLPDPSTLQWMRGGTAPEADRTTFEISQDDGQTWTPLGAGSPIAGGWEITGIAVAPGDYVRARAFVSSGGYEGRSYGIVESFYPSAPPNQEGEDPPGTMVPSPPQSVANAAIVASLSKKIKKLKKKVRAAKKKGKRAKAKQLAKKRKKLLKKLRNL